MSLPNDIKLICCVKDCFNKETETTTLFMFPEDIVNQFQWKIILNINKPISKLFQVCSAHFKESDFIEGNSTKKELKPNSLPSQNIQCKLENPPAKNPTKKVYPNKCGICKEGIGKERIAFTLRSAGSLATRDKWIKILGGKKYIKSKTSICYIHFKPSDFFPRIPGTRTRRTLKKNVVPTLYLNRKLPVVKPKISQGKKSLVCDKIEAEPPLSEIDITKISRSSARLKQGKKMSLVCDKIEDNLNIRRYNFGTAIQLIDDSLDDYFYRLEILAKNCDYNDMKNDLIRDRFIIGINDTNLREKLLLFENLTLDSLIAIANITIKKEIEFVTVDEQLNPEIDELIPEIELEENSNEELEILTEKVKPMRKVIKSSSNKPLEPLFNKKCHKCNETFRSPNCLFQHILLMHSLKFLCKICKAKFHSSEDLMKHVNIYHKPGHTTAKTTAKIPTQIPDPDDYYSSDDSCIPANEIYTYPYMCELCAKLIKNPEQSALHKMEHQGIKPYLCTMCGLSFKAKSALKEHEMVHTGLKPHGCGICMKGFARSYALKSHMWNIHKIETRKSKLEKKSKKNNFEPTSKDDVTMDINFDTFQDN